jgi:hypothetical protein
VADVDTASRVFVTRDLCMAAYLTEICDLELVSGKRNRHGDFEFIVRDPNGEAEAFAVDWVNSDFPRFEDQIQRLKRLIRSGSNRNGRH